MPPHETQRITVIGPGAIGGHIAAVLASSPHTSVSILGKKDSATVKAIRDHGVILNTDSGPQQVTQFAAVDWDPAAIAEPQDMVIVATKVTDMDQEMAEVVNRILKEDGTVILAHNGVSPLYLEHQLNGNLDDIEKRFPDIAEEVAFIRTLNTPNILGSVIYSIANERSLDEDGRYHINLTRTGNNNVLVIGAFDEQSHRRQLDVMQTIQQTLAEADLPSGGIRMDIFPEAGPIKNNIFPKHDRHADNSYPMFWKLRINMLNPICAANGVTIGEMLENANLRQIFFEAMDEVKAVAEAYGVHTFRTNDTIETHLLANSYHHKSSMRVDMEQGMRPERAGLLESVILLAEEKGIDVPTLQFLNDAIATLEVHRDEISASEVEAMPYISEMREIFMDFAQHKLDAFPIQRIDDVAAQKAGILAVTQDFPSLQPLSDIDSPVKGTLAK